MLLAEGLSNKIIAYRLGLTPQTVKCYMFRLYQTIGVDNRTQAAIWWLDYARELEATA